jgi:hypothetical protein
MATLAVLVILALMEGLMRRAGAHDDPVTVHFSHVTNIAGQVATVFHADNQSSTDVYLYPGAIIMLQTNGVRAFVPWSTVSTGACMWRLEPRETGQELVVPFAMQTNAWFMSFQVLQLNRMKTIWYRIRFEPTTAYRGVEFVTSGEVPIMPGEPK